MNDAVCKTENCHYSAEHLKVLATLAVQRFRHFRPQWKTIRDYRQLTSEEFLAELSAVNWRQAVPTSDSCSDQWGRFAALLQEAVDRHAPERRKKTRSPKPPPISDSTKCSFSRGYFFRTLTASQSRVGSTMQVGKGTLEDLIRAPKFKTGHPNVHVPCMHACVPHLTSVKAWLMGL